ncbi:hypothetical protein ES703_95258 [subsurface metagenome]
MTTKDKERAESQAKAQLESIVEMVKALEEDKEIDGQDPRERITEDALEVSVQSDWHTPGEEKPPTNYLILLCTGGPAVRITGELGRYQEPETAELEYQDWFTPWQRYCATTTEEDKALLTYARQFYFGS